MVQHLVNSQLSQAEIARTFTSIHRSGEGFEIRAPRVLKTKYKRTTWAGSFDDVDKAAQAALELSEDNLAPNVSHTLDPVSRDLLGRAYNRITEVESLTADKNVVRLATLYVDADPHRAHG